MKRKNGLQRRRNTTENRQRKKARGSFEEAKKQLNTKTYRLRKYLEMMIEEAKISNKHRSRNSRGEALKLSEEGREKCRKKIK
ncbi:hypothetical protein PIB30_083084, partial [Stylosanthes scabra]|nr:hypothetical protein [Stylosanthes scabra]